MQSVVNILRFVVTNATADRITALFTAVIGITGLAALIYAHRQLKESRRQAQIAHLVNFTREFTGEPTVDYRVSAAQKWLNGDRYSGEFVEFVNFFEEIGLLLNRGYLDAVDTWEMFAATVFPLFLSCKDQIVKDQLEDPNSFTHFVALYRALAQIERKNGGKADVQSEEEIKNFWKEEECTRPGSPVRRRRKKALRKHIEDRGDTPVFETHQN